MSVKVSIITATFNSASTIKDCLESIRLQNRVFEHIIIDGGSQDRTLQLLKEFDGIARIISEPDRGIYDAMNKGIALATGNVIGILNSDDYYASHDVLAMVSNTFENDSIDACYGDLVYIDSEDTRKITRNWKSGSFHPRKFYWGWMPPHPTFFVRRSIYEKYGVFNLFLGSAADYELMLRFLGKHRISTVYIPKVLVKMRSGGTSNVSLKNRLKANRMDRKAWEVNGLKPYPWTIYMKPLRKIPQYFVFGQQH